ncbi:MAG: septum formation initiator family protein [Candidatus Omnitrophica bacterium]|nr:septum formation initiator family protein [Candidatus Omnitrophota bacterium]
MIKGFKKIGLLSGGIFLISFIFLSSFTRLQELKDKSEMMDRMIERLKTESTFLEQQIQYFKEEPIYQEKILREKMGIVRKGEIPIKVLSEE